MHYVDLQKDKYVRFDMSKFMEYSENAYDMFNSFFLQRLQALPVAGVYRVEALIGRPDAISEAIYGDSQYWWLLMEYNDFVSWDDIRWGTLVNYFELIDLERLYFTLGGKQMLLERANRGE